MHRWVCVCGVCVWGCLWIYVIQKRVLWVKRCAALASATASTTALAAWQKGNGGRMANGKWENCAPATTEAAAAACAGLSTCRKRIVKPKDAATFRGILEQSAQHTWPGPFGLFAVCSWGGIRQYILCVISHTASNCAALPSSLPPHPRPHTPGASFGRPRCHVETRCGCFMRQMQILLNNTWFRFYVDALWCCLCCVRVCVCVRVAYVYVCV